MKSMINTLLLCFILKSCKTYYLYENNNGKHKLTGYLREHNSLSFSDNEDSQSESEAYVQSNYIYNKFEHRHRRMPSKHFHHQHNARSRMKCSCKKCHSHRNKNCETFCDENCSQDHHHDNDHNSMSLNYIDMFPHIAMTPKIIRVPYPLPVIVTQRVINTQNINPSSVTTDTPLSTGLKLMGTSSPIKTSTISLRPAVFVKDLNSPSTKQQKPMNSRTTEKGMKYAKYIPIGETSSISLRPVVFVKDLNSPSTKQQKPMNSRTTEKCMKYAKYIPIGETVTKKYFQTKSIFSQKRRPLLRIAPIPEFLAEKLLDNLKDRSVYIPGKMQYNKIKRKKLY